MRRYSRVLRIRILRKISKILRRRAVWLRAALCLAIGMMVLMVGGNANYDLRFAMRGVQPIDSHIVMIQISQDEWIHLHNGKQNWIRPLKEITHLTDSFYWDPKSWSLILRKLLRQDPKVIGVSFFFGNNIRRPYSRYLYAPEFTDSRIVWLSRLNSDGRMMFPVFATAYGHNSGIVEVKPDNDGVVRTFQTKIRNHLHFALKLAERFIGHGPQVPATNNLARINFRGPSGTFPQMSLTDFLQGNYPAHYFKNKIVVIGSLDSQAQLFRTPVGEMNRTEIVANIADNALHHRWIQRLGYWPSTLYLAILLLITVWIISTYPQSLALVFYLWIGTSLSALSLWIFDAHYFWLPLLAPIVEMAATFIVFLSFQLTVKDNLNWRLEQERKYFLQVEELKNNFVSLISHDLKTPIAKIQAICDRLLAHYPQEDFVGDMTSLRRESSELHRYIQSILQITKVESREFKLHKEAGDINEVITEVLDQLAPLATDKSIGITTDLEPMFLIEFDSVLIREVILNLVENAIKYTGQGGHITVRSYESEDSVQIEVEDNGIGVDEEEQQKIFEKFYRTQKSTAKGSGLGLYLAKYFIELHGGKIFLESRAGQGTRVAFSLPMGDESDSETKVGDLSWKTNLGLS